MVLFVQIEGYRMLESRLFVDVNLILPAPGPPLLNNVDFFRVPNGRLFSSGFLRREEFQEEQIGHADSDCHFLCRDHDVPGHDAPLRQSTQWFAFPSGPIVLNRKRK